MSSKNHSSGSKSIELGSIDNPKKRKTMSESTLNLPTTTEPFWEVSELPASAPASPALGGFVGNNDDSQDSIHFLLLASATPPSNKKPSDKKPAWKVKTRVSIIGKKLVFNPKEKPETKSETKK